MIRATVYPTMADGSSADAIAEIERPRATSALRDLAESASAAIELAIHRDPEVVGLRIELAEAETVEQRAVQILRDAGIDAYLQHTGGGIWVVEAKSDSIADRFVWVTDSEGNEAGPYLAIAYVNQFAEEGIESLSGACPEDRLVARVKAGLTTEHHEGAA